MIDPRRALDREPDDPRQSPVHLRSELLGMGLSDKAIARQVAGGALHRLRYGSYVDGAAWRDCDDAGRHGLLLRAAVKRAQAEVVASHLSALGEWEVPLWDVAPGPVHLTRADEKAGRREAGIVQHLGALREKDVVDLHGLRVTSPTRTALDCVGLLDTEHGVAIVGDLLHRGLTSRAELEDARLFMQQWPGSLRHQVVMAIADGRCESVGEHRTLFLCWQEHLPRPEPQYEVLDGRGGVLGRLDFAWPQYGVFLEFDGLVKYRRHLRAGESVEQAVIREKQREEAVCEATGWRCIRIVWADLYRPGATAERIRRLLVMGGLAGVA